MTSQKKIKVLSVFGTRPEAIKMAPLVLEMGKSEKIESKVLVTGQHREMLDSVLELFNIKPDFDLNIMKHGQTIEDITTKVVYGVSDIIKNQYRPDIVLVHGDTTTSFASALGAFYQKVAVGHVEAGLRTNNIYSPYPEEMNRRLVGTIASYHFCPTIANKENLEKENISQENVIITGNTVIDALQIVTKNDYKFEDEILNKLDKNKKTILLTCHRRENWGKPMEDIFEAVQELATEYKEKIQVVYPVHMNPNIRKLAKEKLICDNIYLIEPQDYAPFANLMNKSYIIMTDSGGMQEEAPSLGKPVVVLRTETERPEAVSSGTVKLAGVKKEDIKRIVKELLDNQEAYNKMAHAVNPYGDGKASHRIVEYIEKNL